MRHAVGTLVVTLVVAPAAVGCSGTVGCPSRQDPVGDWPSYPSVRALTETADVVLVAEVVRDDDGEPDVEVRDCAQTLTTVRVTRVLKDDGHVGAEIDLAQDGIEQAGAGDTVYLADLDSPAVLVFAARSSGTYRTLNPTESVYRVDGDEVTRVSGADGDLVPTMRQVRRLAR